jgi:dephospho-CoA kinase
VSHFVVGVSGGIGSGKTTVTNIFSSLGVEVVDADVIAREVVSVGTPGLNAIVKKFGQQIVSESGELNRSSLRQLVFSQPELKEWLNRLLHPLIREQMQQQTQSAKSVYCILSVPLLVENNLIKSVDRVLIVDVSEATQLQRTIRRDNSNEQQISAIMRAQASREQRLAVADDVVLNEGSPIELLEKVTELHQCYLKLAASKISLM